MKISIMKAIEREPFVFIGLMKEEMEKLIMRL